MLLIASDRLYATVYANIIGQTLETATCSCQVIVRSYMPFNSLLKDEMFLSTFALLIALIVLHASCFEKLFSLFFKKKPREFASNLIASQVIGIKTLSPSQWRDKNLCNQVKFKQSLGSDLPKYQVLI